jgi:hypothetical protein
MFIKKLLLILLAFALIFFLNCGAEQPDKSNSKENSENEITGESICELLSKEDVGNIMGAKFEETLQSVHTVNPEAGSYVSQCGYYTNNGLQHVAVLVRYFKGTAFPQTAKDFLNASRTGDAEMDAEMDKALENHINVQGVGDAAFFYSLWESNSLVVHWNKSYEMIISMYDFNLDEPTMEKIKKLAKEVMSKF